MQNTSFWVYKRIQLHAMLKKKLFFDKIFSARKRLIFIIRIKPNIHNYTLIFVQPCFEVFSFLSCEYFKLDTFYINS